MTTHVTDQASLETFNRSAGAESHWISIAELVSNSEQVAGMLVDSEPARKVMAAIDRIAPYKAAVLVHGESGSARN